MWDHQVYFCFVTYRASVKIQFIITYDILNSMCVLVIFKCHKGSSCVRKVSKTTSFREQIYLFGRLLLLVSFNQLTPTSLQLKNSKKKTHIVGKIMELSFEGFPSCFQGLAVKILKHWLKTTKRGKMSPSCFFTSRHRCLSSSA